MSDDYRAGAIVETAHFHSTGQRITVNLLKSAALAAGQIREEIAAIKATAAATADADSGSPMIRTRAPAAGAADDAARQSPPLDLHEPTSPFIQVAGSNILHDSAMDSLPSGEQQAPPKPDDDSEESPLADSRWQAAQRSKLADSLDAGSSLSGGRLEERLNECVHPPARASNDEKNEGQRFLRGPAKGAMVTGVDSRDPARSGAHPGADAPAISSPGVRPRRIRASVLPGSCHGEEASAQRQELITRMQQANLAMRQIRRPVRKGATSTIASKAQPRPAKEAAAKKAPSQQPTALVTAPLSRAAPATRKTQRQHHGSAVQTHISLSALLGAGTDDGSGDGGGDISMERVLASTLDPQLPVAETLSCPTEDPPVLLAPEVVLSEEFVTPVGSPVKQSARRKAWGQAVTPEQIRTPLSSPVRQPNSSKVLEALAAAAAATAAQQSAASSLKERLAAVASAATSARQRSAVTTPRKGPLPASPTKVTGDLSPRRSEAEGTNRLGTPFKVSTRGTYRLSSGAAGEQVSAAYPASVLPASEPAEGPKQGGAHPQPAWPKPHVPPPMWHENPGPALPEGYTTPRRKPLRHAGAAFSARSPMVGPSPASEAWPGSRAPSMASDATSDSTPLSKDAKQKPYTPAGARIRRWEEPAPSSSKRCRPSPASPSSEEGDKDQNEDDESFGVGLFPDHPSVRQSSPLEVHPLPGLPTSYPPAVSFTTTPPAASAGSKAEAQALPQWDSTTEVAATSGDNTSEVGGALPQDEVRTESPYVEAAEAEGSASAVANAFSVLQLNGPQVKEPELNQQRLKRQSSALGTGLASRWSRRIASVPTTMLSAANPPPPADAQPSAAQGGIAVQAAPEEDSTTADEDVLAAILGRPSRSCSDQRSPPSKVFHASPPNSAHAVATCGEFPTPSSLASCDLALAAEGIQSMSPRESSLSSPLTRSEISLRQSWGTRSLHGPGLRGSGSSTSSGSLSRLGDSDHRSSGASQKSGITRQVTAAPAVSGGLGGRPDMGRRTETVRGKGGAAQQSSSSRGGAPLEVATRLRKPWNMSITLQTSEASQHSGGSPGGSAGEVRLGRSPGTFSRGGMSAGSASGGGTSMVAAASGSVWGGGYGGGMSDSPESVRGGGSGWSCGSPIPSGGGSTGNGGGGGSSGQDLRLQGRSEAVMKDWTKLALSGEPLGVESPPAGSTTLLGSLQSVDFSAALQSAAGTTVGQHPLGRRLLHERPGLRVAAADLLAALEAGLLVHKAWMRTGSCAAGGSQRMLQVRVEPLRLGFTYCSGVMRRPRSFDIVSVHVNDKERYIQVGTKDGEQMLLNPITSESYALWVLGLNAALACATGISVGTDSINNMPWAL